MCIDKLKTEVDDALGQLLSNVSGNPNNQFCVFWFGDPDNLPIDVYSSTETKTKNHCGAVG